MIFHYLNRTKKFIFYLSVLSIVLSACHKPEKFVVIQGRFLGYTKGATIQYYMPIGGYSNFNIYNTTTVLNDSGDFKIKVNIDSAGFVKVWGGRTMVYMLVQNGDSINFKEQSFSYPDKYAMSPIFFTGSNAEMHYLYNKMNANLFYKFNYMTDLLAKKYPAGTNIYDSLTAGINRYLLPFDSLYKAKKIPAYYLAIIKSDFRNVMFSDAITGHLHVLEENNPWVIPEAEDDMKRNIYRSVINVDPYLMHTNFGSSITIAFIDDYQKLFWTKDYPVYDSFLYKYGRFYKESAHLIPEWNKYEWGSTLIIQKMHGDDNKEFSFDTLFAYYKKTYPASPFIKIIQDIPAQNNNVDYRTANNNITIIDSVQSIQSLKEILDKYFKGTPVFVDLWATWCVPCKDEFAFNKDLDLVLKNKKIKKLYISEDGLMTRKDSWINYIYKTNLEGYHILAGKQLMKDISRVIYDNVQDQYIPRYFLFDKNGALVDKDLPRPSSIVLYPFYFKNGLIIGIFAVWHEQKN